MNQPKKSHWASLAAALGAAPAENLNDEPSSETPEVEELQDHVEPAAEKQESCEAPEIVETPEPVAEIASPVEEPAIEAEAPEETAEAEEPVAIAPPTKRHWAGLAQSLGLPVERLFGKAAPVETPAPAKPSTPKPPAAKPVAKKPEPKPSVVEKELTEKAVPSRAESTARTMFEERPDSPETEKRAASLFIQIDSTTKKSSESNSDAPRNLLPGDEIFFDTGEYDLIDDMKDEPDTSNYDRDDHEDDNDDAPREVVARKRAPKEEAASDDETGTEEATDESGSPRPRRRRRRRGRRRDSRSETTTAEEGAEEETSTESTEVAAELEPTAKKSSDSDDDSESTGAPRRRRRRRRSRKADEGEARKTPEVSAKRELTDVDFPDDEDDDDTSISDVYDDDDDDDQDMRRHRNIPSWLDAVTAIVELNIERHKTAPQHSDRRSGGGGGGRRRRGGGRRPAAN
ncbi:hypothetical protein [Blastopirellula marina]|uniref:Uncharacterized protein n=1 Tax=Blastopirellula marina DSM 3645 TaxID=314230 RepID=A3ZZW9_9BACT|nr:hypothetical protein [Blastopirellula marina]EAQ77913.1 hypothetical protein DSM3645_27081 [Blastopirellula marina DSM 3645]